MINRLVKKFYDLSEKHKLIRGFKYGTLSKRSGIGEDAYPLVFMESPIYVGDVDLTAGIVPVTVNFDIVATPQRLQNWLGIDTISEEVLQSFCHSIALNFVAKMRQDYKEGETRDEVAKYGFLTLTNWKDDNACGVRCTMVLNIPNPIFYCDVDEHFDPEKKFDFDKMLPEINTDDADGCVIFQKDSLLPTINL